MSGNSRIKSIIRLLNVYSLLALAVIVGPILLIITNLVASLYTSGYSFIGDSISSLAWTPMGWLQSIGFLVAGLMVEVFTVGLFFSIRGTRGFKLGIGLLVLFGFGLLMIGAFKEDPTGSPRTIQDMIHVVTATFIFSVFPIASLLIGLSLRKDPYWKGLFIHTIATTSLASAFVIGYLFLPDQLSWFGLYERVLLANIVIWIGIMAFKLLRLSLSASDRLKSPTIFLERGV